MGGSKVEDDKLRIKILEDLFACQFRSTYKDIFFDRSRSSDDRFRPFYNCIGKEIHKVDRCLHLIQDICDRSLVRIAKVIRMRGNTIFKMMENHPDLKVIHLLRDPRAILNSLREMRLSFVMEKKAEYLCDYMKSNSIEFDSIFKLYPNQAATIFYESLAKDPIDMTKKLYDFIGIKTTDNVLAWIKENMLGKQLNNETYTVRNRNALSVSNKWRNQLKIEDINTIDAICKDFYDMSGYAEVGDLEELKDSKIFHFRDDSKLIASDLKHMNEDAISLNGKRSLK